MKAGPPAALRSLVDIALAGAKNSRQLFPGERPRWVVVELHGHLAPRPEKRRFFGFALPSGIAPQNPSLDALVESLDALGRASWLTGVVLRFEGWSADPATAYALRRAVSALRGAGKRVVAFLTSIDSGAYYVASAANEVVAPESADVGLHGAGVSVTFMREALAKLGVRFEKLAIDEYKNAFDNLVRDEMTAPHREQLEVLLQRIEEHTHDAIASSRGIAPEAVRALVDEGITSAERAREAKLLDRVAYEDEIVGEGHATLAEAERFLGTRVPPLGGGRVGIVAITGGIVPGRTRRVPSPLGSSMVGSETVVRALRTAGADASTKAVVLFVDSPGGSALASDLIGREVRVLRDKKPVVAVMGAVAASGGYYVLTHASRVIAAPTTVTGSIGVITGKLVVDELFARWGLKSERVQRGRFALMMDPAAPLTEDERALLRRANDEIYARFVARVADGRRLSVERVRELARGRVWAGTDALAHGLVDELGDLETGLARARELAGLPANAPAWEVEPRQGLVLPGQDADAIASFASGSQVEDAVRQVTRWARETSWLVSPAWYRWG
jgi:protease-4